MPPDITDTVCEYLGIITHVADGTTLSVTEVHSALSALIDNYPIKPLNFGEGSGNEQTGRKPWLIFQNNKGYIPQWDFEEIAQNPTGNPTTELVPFTDSELTELLFRE
jgi:hypothetical protein